MFRMIGFVIVIYALSKFLGGAFMAFEGALVETFGAIEAAAIQSQKQIDTID